MLRKHLPEHQVPSGFEIDFVIHKNVLTFNMIDEQDVKNIIEILRKLISRMEGDVHVSRKNEYNEAFYFPFDARGSMADTLITVNIKYRTKTKWDIRSVNIQRHY